MKALGRILAFGLFGLWALTASAQPIRALDPHLTAAPGSLSGTLSLRWNESPDATGYTLRRRSGPGEAWTTLTQLPGHATSFDDPAAPWGRTFEYHLLKLDAEGPHGQAWVRAGADVPFDAADARGVAAIVVDAKTAAAEGLPERLERLARDLRGDGFAVEQLVVGDDDSDTPPEVKARIWELHARVDGRLRAVILLGAVPRPFSGNLAPDAHPDHQGAWPADGYYADPSEWTDSLNLGGAGPFANTSGDGKFDHSTHPGPLELRVGRIDAEGMGSFSPLEGPALVARYLDANHAYRHAHARFARRAYVRDTFGHFGGEAFARIGFRDGAAVLGAPAMEDAERSFFDVLEAPDGYALAFGSGGGTPTSASGIATTSDFVTRAPRVVFLGLFGSYFGDWSYDDNLLRAALLSPGEVLASAWFARPYLHLHGLGALQSFGDAFVESANNEGTGYDVGSQARSVHQALLGDPTLRLFVIPPPRALVLELSASGMGLRWEPPLQGDPGDGPVRYHVYRRGLDPAAAFEDEVRITPSPIASTSLFDPSAAPGARYTWRVVAVQRVKTGSGTFFQHSQGAMVEGARPSSMTHPPDAGTAPLDGDGGEGSGGGGPGPATAGCGCSSTPVGAQGLALLLSLLLLRGGRGGTRRPRAA